MIVLHLSEQRVRVWRFEVFVIAFCDCGSRFAWIVTIFYSDVRSEDTFFKFFLVLAVN